MPTRTERAVANLVKAVEAIPDKKSRQAVADAIDELGKAVKAEGDKIAEILGVSPWIIPSWTRRRGRTARRR